METAGVVSPDPVERNKSGIADISRSYLGKITPRAESRYWEIDLARGTAVITMVLFHFLFDLEFLGVCHIGISSWFWRGFAMATASTFVFLVGLSLSISYARTRHRLSGMELYLKYLRRGLGIFALGMIITVATMIYPGRATIVFGILHLIGLSIIIAPVFFKAGWWNLPAGLIAILSGIILSDMSGPIWLAWLGLHPAVFISLDYEPLLPWFGLVLLGLYAGSVLYPKGERRFALNTPRNRSITFMTFLGRHSLAIYLVHQPVILFLIWLLT